MYQVTIEHPAIKERTYTADTPGELRDIVWGVARAQGEPVTDDLAMINKVGALCARSDNGGIGVLAVHDITVKVEGADPAAYECEGHEGEDAVLLGGPTRCDGRCKPRKRFRKPELLYLSLALDNARLEAEGGCAACELEADQMCADCGQCNCDRHDTCVRPAGEGEPSRKG
ncbi:hypothetical protein ACFVH9_08435 [Streptomyces hirsutus]|uniref:hypothetical protein n=1 Tax=Streptomyces hirsutus TaxID=35620 RepID=UPI00363F64D6